MADVITKLRINEDFHDGRVVFTSPISSGIQSSLSTDHDYAARINSGSIEDLYTTRFDDPTYYTA